MLVDQHATEIIMGKFCQYYSTLLFETPCISKYFIETEKLFDPLKSSIGYFI